MKTKIPTTIEVTITHVLVNLPVRYGEDDIPNDFPLRDGDWWNAKIDIDTGKIEGWPEGKTGSFYMKVVDMGTYRLLDDKGTIVLSIANDYVPHGVIPGECGDYVDFTIDESGTIVNWPKKPDIRQFLRTDED